MACRILYLTTHNPYGEIYGASLRALQIGEALSKIGRVTLVLAQTSDVPSNDIEILKEKFPDVKTLSFSENSDKSFIDYTRRNLSLSIGNSFNFGCSLAEKRNFSKWASENDLIWFYGLRIPSALGFNENMRTFLDIDDIQSQLYRLESINQPKYLIRISLSIQARMWRLREAQLPNLFSGLGVCSEADRVYLGTHSSIHVIPNGFQGPKQVPQPHPASPVRIGFIGTFKYSPNVEGMKWFIKKVWPFIKEKYPTARLRLVGSKTDGSITELGKDVEGLGYLTDPDEEIASWSLMVIPIFVGGGTRIKIAEGFSRKCPVVSSSIGAYGYDVIDGKELLVADTIESFANACLKLIQRNSEAAEMSERAWNKFLGEWTWEAINPRIWRAVEDCLRCHPGKGKIH